MKAGLWSSRIESEMMLLKFAFSGDFWNTMDNQEYKQMNHQTNLSWLITQGTNAQDHIMTFWAHYMKIYLSWEVYNARKGRTKEKKKGQQASKWMDWFTSAMGGTIGNLKGARCD